MPIIKEDIIYRGYSFSIPGDLCRGRGPLHLRALIMGIIREQPNQPIYMETLPNSFPLQGYPLMIVGNSNTPYSQLGSIRDKILTLLEHNPTRRDNTLEEEFFSRRKSLCP